MDALLVEGGSQAKVMNLVEVMTASRLEGAEGRLFRTVPRLLEVPGPSNERGRAVVTIVESAEQNKKKEINKNMHQLDMNVNINIMNGKHQYI